MARGGSERAEMLQHPLADRFRGVIEGFGGTRETADELLSRFRSLEEGGYESLTADIFREGDEEHGISGSWVSLKFNPLRKSLTTTISVAGTARQVLAEDRLHHIDLVRCNNMGDVTFTSNRDRRLLLLHQNSTVTSVPYY